MTPKQVAFVSEYLIDLSATQAAIRAGYSRNRAGEIGYQQLQKTTIQQAISAAIAARSQRTAITADYVLETIRDTVERCRQTTPVLDGKGQPVLVESPSGELKPSYTFDAANALKGCDLLGKNLGLWKDVGSANNPLNTNLSIKVTFEGE